MTFRATRILASLATVTALSVLAACGTPAVSTEPAPTTSVPTAEPSTPVPTATRGPLSPFEDDPAVQQVRQFAALAAQSINADDPDLTAASDLMGWQGQGSMRKVMAVYAGQTFPGPLPFTPVSIEKVSDVTTFVNACVMVSGFTVDRATGKPIGEPTISPKVFLLNTTDGITSLNNMNPGTVSCDGVHVPTPLW